MFETIDLSFAIAKKAFKPVQDRMLERIVELSELVYERGRPAIIVFEGWDAAGKGTTIRTLTAPLDARGFKVLSTQAPRTHEKQKPWLWRFWMNIPRHGQIAIFDRSWYGRVLVERVEGLTPVPEWIAAYEEINQFERTLADDGTIFMKFWLHISKEEQLRRFLALSQDPATFWQVAAEDWDHHRKYQEYLAAVRDMLANTHTPCAPWTVVPATDREYRLYTVFRTIIERLETGLDCDRTRWPAPEALDAYNLDAQAEKAARKKAKAQKKAAAAAAGSDGKGKQQKAANGSLAETPGKKKKQKAGASALEAPAGEPASSQPKQRKGEKKKKHGGPDQAVAVAPLENPAAPPAVLAVTSAPAALTTSMSGELALSGSAEEPVGAPTAKQRGRRRQPKTTPTLTAAGSEE